MQFDNDEQKNFFVGLINNYVNALNNSKQSLEENLKNVQGALASIERTEIGCCGKTANMMKQPIEPVSPGVV